VLTRFERGTDTLKLSDVIFSGIAGGPLNASIFVAEAGASAHDSGERILYELRHRQCRVRRRRFGRAGSVDFRDALEPSAAHCRGRAGRPDLSPSR
jgi:hypothetical protein